MELFLSGEGIYDDSKGLDDLFAASLDRSKPLLYIPIAMDQTKRPYSECFKFISKVFNPRGIKNIVMWTEKDLEENHDKLDEFSGIYIGGGNTFYLLKKIKETNFDKILVKAIKNGIPFYGGSAGAIICGKSIQPAELFDTNFVDLKDLRGLNLLNNYSVICHYRKEDFEKIKLFQKNNGLSIIALPEDSGLLYKNNSLKVVGKSPAVIFK